MVNEDVRLRCSWPYNNNRHEKLGRKKKQNMDILYFVVQVQGNISSEP